MIRTFLKAKHWQLFTLIFAIPMFIQFTMMSMILSDVTHRISGISETDINPTMMMETMMSHTTNFMTVFSIVMLFIIVMMFGWYWAVGVGLQAKIPEAVKMNVKKFKFFYWVSVIYSLFFVGFLAFLAAYLPMLMTGVMSFSALSWVLSISIFIHFLAVFAMFYCLYFTAKTIKTAELQRETTFNDFIGEFLLIWFFPIGVWILQPRINALVNQDFHQGEDMDWLDDM